MLVIQRPSVAALGEAVGNRQKFSVSPLEPSAAAERPRYFRTGCR